MRKIVSITVTLLLIISCCIGFAGCGGNKGPVHKTHEELGYQWEDTSAPIVKEKGLVSYNITTPKNSLADDYNQMKVFKDLYDSTNVGITWNCLGEATYSAQKNLIISNKNNWPDALYHAGFSDIEINQYSRRGYLTAISDYLNYMPNFKKLLEDRPDIKSQISAADGKIYALPRIEEMGLKQNSQFLFMNKGWIEKLIDSGDVTFLTKTDLKDGLNLTLAQLETILSLFRDRDLNSNGKANDEIPINFVYQNWQGNESDLFAIFGLPENNEHRTIINGQVVYTAIDDKYKTAVNHLAGWVSNGIIDEVVLEQSQDEFLAGGRGVEKYGAFYWWEKETVVTLPDNYICLNPIIGPGGTQILGLSNEQEIVKGQFIIFTSCANPEVLLTYVDRFFDPFVSAQINYGPIGVVYEEELDNKGMLVQKAIPPGMTTDELRFKNAPMGIMYLGEYAWNNVVNMEPRAKLRLERLEAHATPFVPKNIKKFPNLSYTTEELNTLNSIEQNISDYVAAKKMSWLLGGGVNDSEWATYKSTLNGSLKLSTLISVYQAAYNRYASEI